jgi:hypothetical protein
MFDQNRACEVPWMAAARDVAPSPERSGVVIRRRSCGTGIPRGQFGGGAVDLMGGEKALRFQRRHAPHPGRGHRLAIHVIGDIAGSEHAGHRSGGRGRGLDVAGRFHLDLAGEQFGGRRVANGDEHAVGGNGGMHPGLDVAQLDLCDLARLLGATDLGHLMVPDHFDLGVLEQALLQDALGAERVAAMDHGHLVGEIGEEQRLLDGGVAAADHHDFLALVEKPVAGGAGGNAVAAESLLGGKPQPARLGAGGDDQGVRHIGIAGIAGDAERPPAEIDGIDVVGDELGAHMGGLLLHLFHQPGALDDIGKARIVFDIGGDRELAARLDSLDQDWLQHGARGIDGRRIARWPGTDDDDLGMNGIGHGFL